jgi:peptidyl-prolyl cis-trans isomerase C
LTVLKRILTEPFVHFLVIGAALFLLGERLERQQQADRYAITVGSAELKRFAGLWEKQYGGEPSADELNELAENYIRQEVLYREAISLGLDKGDEVVKRRMVQKLEFLQQDLWTAQEPPDSELQEYYREHPERYQKPERVSFRHLYFSADKPGDAKQRAAAALVELDQGKPQSGDRFPDHTEFTQQSREDVKRVFGNSPVAFFLFEQPLRQWVGPFQSGLGWHLVYVEDKTPAAQAKFESVRLAVKNDWQQALRQRKNAEAFDMLKQRYTIVREPSPVNKTTQMLVSK